VATSQADEGLYSSDLHGESMCLWALGRGYEGESMEGVKLDE
jgi:hypothetical protein